jgi:hypothetical protein
LSPLLPNGQHHQVPVHLDLVEVTHVFVHGPYCWAL